MNFTFDTLQIKGHGSQPVPNTFIRQTTPTAHVAILLPGVGYTVHMPLLYYTARALTEMGADVLRVETMYVKEPDYNALSPADKARRVFGDASAACRVALAQRAYTRITLVGKSLGTLAMGHLFSTEPALAHAEAIWLTPLLWNNTLRAQIERVRPRSLFAAGTADPYHHAERLSAVQAVTQGQAVIIEGANHSLEIEGDITQSLEALRQVVQAIIAFLNA